MLWVIFRLVGVVPDKSHVISHQVFPNPNCTPNTSFDLLSIFGIHSVPLEALATKKAIGIGRGKGYNSI